MKLPKTTLNKTSEMKRVLGQMKTLLTKCSANEDSMDAFNALNNAQAALADFEAIYKKGNLT